MVAGGFGYVNGAIAASFLIGVTEALAGSYVSYAYKDAIAFLIMIAGAALAAAGPVRPPDRDLTCGERAGSCWARWSSTVPWLVAAVAPRQQRYILHVLIFTAIFAALALSYDLVVGHVGSLSLAHPAFFGIGAYTAAILATRAGWPFVAGVRRRGARWPRWWPRSSACRCSG